MNVRELMNEAIANQYKSLIALIQLLVIEKKVITFEDDISKLDYYLQERFKEKINQYLSKYSTEE